MYAKGIPFPSYGKGYLSPVPKYLIYCTALSKRDAEILFLILTFLKIDDYCKLPFAWPQIWRDLSLWGFHQNYVICLERPSTYKYMT